MPSRPADDPAELGNAATQMRGPAKVDMLTQSSEGANGPEQTFAPSGAQPSQFGRYVILSRLGAGGMGVVFSAYDPDLDRKIAIKLLPPGHLDGEGRIRLLREAQAMARLSHPQVVQVHDVGMIARQVFVAMEFVQGVDLEAWLAAEPRQWSDVLRVYLDAGRGLAAAHAADIVHRDFKPSNVLIGADGRVRVADFGLARHWEGSVDGSMSSSDALLAAPLTMTGTVVGTPAFMSPEQHAGSELDARSDQFSFCVALFEGLYRARPFAGETLGELRAAVITGCVIDPPANTPAPRWLLPILKRGLATRPEDRFPDLPSLLAALDRDPRRTRRKWLLGLGGAGAATALAGVLLQAAPEQCTDARVGLTDTWDAERRDALDRRLTELDHPQAPETRDRVLSGFDAYADGWVAARTAACVDHHRGYQSSDLLDRRMRCLDARKHALASAVSVVQDLDATRLSEVVVVVAKLPALAACEDVEWLMAENPPPENPALAAVADDLEHRLITARTLLHAGELTRATDEARAVESEATSAGLRPQLATATLLRGQAEMAGGNSNAAPDTLRAAFVASVRASRDELAAEALSRWIYVTGADRGETEVGLAELPLALAFVDRLPRPDAELARLQNNVGAVYVARRERAAAQQSFATAVEATRRGALVDPVERAHYMANLALVTAEATKRSELLTDSLDLLRRELGEHHVQTIGRRMVLAATTLDPEVASELQASACSDLETVYPELKRLQADCLFDLGRRLGEIGRTDQAAEALRRAAAIRDEIPAIDAGERLQYQALTRRDAGFAAFFAGAPHQALTELAVAFPVFEDAATGRWWLQKMVAEMQLVQGQALMALGRFDEASAPLLASRAFFLGIVGDQERADVAFSLAHAEISLAEVSWQAGERSAANDLARSARRFYAAVGDGYGPRISWIDAWLAAHPA